MNKRPAIADDQFFQNLADDEDIAVSAPARLKARIHSALVRESQKESSLRALSETRRAGYELCRWEKVMQVVPGAGSINQCRFCHARVLAETLAHAPLPWSGCPYAQFHRP
ncbi:MAG: hypothetical protein WB784_08425 [Rhodanobacteraceae bacterium]